MRQDDFRALTEKNHWLGWIGTSPAAEIRQSVEEILRAQVPGTVIDWMRILPEPYFLTGGRRDGDDKIIVTRAALAVDFECQVTADGRPEQLRAVFSWVAVGLDAARRDRVWLDFDVDLAAASELLKQRIYELSATA
jgi:hypothetical protein